jgi:adenosylhomocysteine nucleosidase
MNVPPGVTPWLNDIRQPRGGKMLGIIGAEEEEIKLLSQWLENKTSEKFWQLSFTRGCLAGREVVLLCCGVGKVNAAVGTALLIDHYKPEAIINTGSAGGLHADLKVGDAVISSGLLYFDVDVTSFGRELGQVPGMPAVYKADEALAALAEQSVASLKAGGILPGDFRTLRGQIASGDQFMDKPERIEAVRKNFPDALAVEMEGAAIAQTAYLASLPFLIIRAISDVAGKTSSMSFEEFLPLAAKNSAEIVRSLCQLAK